MLRLSYKYSRSDGYKVKYNLDNLTRRLKKGMILKGRIVDCFEGNKYLLRVWGYNMLTESERSFKQFEEIRLEVQRVKPYIVFQLHSNGHHFEGIGNNNRTNIIVR